ncbi:uncharacterized protein LOC143578505 [Bidens hawaiensis]|uniref:uncharacterized protein LOC143578505 n=1 Tax=Bidens hawaiensis TaxID=980011 RepID=UPI00404AA643
MLFAKDMIVPTSYNPNPNIPGHNKRLRKIFKGGVGALDGTLINDVVPNRQQDLCRGRVKGDCYQNVLAICDFNMIFMFHVAGWEMVAHDSRILSERNTIFVMPRMHIRGFMAPYHNVRYWLGDFRRRRALTNKEKFNHAHAKLRNVIERAFGVLKARFPKLKRMAPFPLETQRNVTVACFALHNFIRKQGLDDELFTQYDQPDVSLGNSRGHIDADEDEFKALDTASDREYMTQLRDEIAE